ncbi:hypothetical protein L596_005330 [Steinernema carpocapsae]|uniref:Renin receptor-like C-terminal transmembrane spanning segment domain-containing protein n=1 Tax=Steinernema carpocapsae TaxID=34508 RepID=A0A4U8V048_STECR|nr:hypothetical protein L596_005330 [Steinernema carpocapsae]
MHTLPVLVLLAGIATVSFSEELNGINKLHEEARIAFNVYAFPSSDYPAMFAIFAGLIIILALAVLFIVVGMMSMDPSKDSIIYRMTTTRQKKD